MLQIHISNFFPLFRETETNGFLKRSRFRFRFWVKTEIRFGFSVYRTALSFLEGANIQLLLKRCFMLARLLQEP